VYEEKRTDVNIGTRLIGDCHLDIVDTLVLVSADSDLISPLQFIKEHFPTKKIRVYFPPDLNSSALASLMRAENKKVVRLEYSKPKFLNSVMPDIITANASTFSIPDKWKI